MLLVDHLPEGPGADGPDGAILHEQNGVGAVYDGVEIVGDHQHGTLISCDGILQGDLGEGVQMAGGLVQQQQVCIARCQLCQLQQILLTTGQVAHLPVQGIGVEAVFFQVFLHLGGGAEAQVVELLVDGILLLQDLRMELGEEGGSGFFGEMDGGMVVFPNLAEHGGLAGAVGTHQGYLLAGMDGKGNIVQQLFLEGQGIVLQLQQLHRLFRDLHFRQADIRLPDLHEGCLDLPGHKAVQVADLALQGPAQPGIDDLRGILPDPLHQLRDPLNFRFILDGCQLQIDLLLEPGAAVLVEAALIVQQVAVFQMPDPVEAVGQKIPAVGDHQQCAGVAVDQVPQAV